MIVIVLHEDCAFLFSSETVSSLLNHMLNGDSVESVVVNGISILQTLLECRKVRYHVILYQTMYKISVGFAAILSSHIQF